MKFIFVHGRGQQAKDPQTLESEWVNALASGASAAGISFNSASMPDNTLFPYYGDILISEMNRNPDSTSRRASSDPDDNNRSSETPDDHNFTEDEEINAFLNEVDLEIFQERPNKFVKIDLNDIERGPLNWPVTLEILGWIDKNSSKSSAAIIARTLRDVGAYLEKASVRKAVDSIVEKAVENRLERGDPFTIVAHSLGSIVVYSVLHQLSRKTKNTSLINLITVGSPLAIGAVKNRLKKIGLPLEVPELVKSWTNASDVRDVVALVPRIDNNTFFEKITNLVNNLEVHNETSNRHGISGYLNKHDVAKAILKST